MEVSNSELPPRPPSAFNALINGFNAITGNVSVILFPVALDMFLWLGPRLKVENLFLSTLQELARLQGTTPAMLFPSVITPAEMEKSLSGFNFFSNLRTYPLGVFSLMMSNISDRSPLGARFGWEIQNWFVLLVGFLFLTCIGLLSGSLYFYLVSRVALKPENGPGPMRTIFHSLLLWGPWTLILLMMYPFLQLAFFFLANNPIVAVLFFLFLAWPVTWLGLMVFFSAHGVFVQAKNALDSVAQIFRILRYGMPPMGWFALMAVIISSGMDLIWSVPSTESWMMLVGIFGHAFIATGLLSASFIFYRDLSSWVDKALEWVKTHQITSARA